MNSIVIMKKIGESKYCKKIIQAAGLVSLLFIVSLGAQEWSEPVKLPDPINPGITRNNYPFLTRDGSRLYFCSNRGLGSTEDIYYCDRAGNSWNEAVRLGDQINSRAREISPSVTADGQTLYFCRHTTAASWDIFYCTLEDSGWSKPINIGPPVNTPGKEFTACISSGGDTLVFEGPHYIDTMYPPDLMYSVKIDTGWAYPNLFFNEYDGNKSWERGPWISTDGKMLYFFTAYHKDWGQDIYCSRWTGSVWTMPENIGSPINTEQAEMRPTFSPDGNTIYFARLYNEGDTSKGEGIWMSTRIIDKVSEKKVKSTNDQFFAFPNPFNSFVNIVYDPRYEWDHLKIYNLLGKEVKTVHNNFGQTGPDTIRWDGTDQNNQPVPSGVYLCSINAKDGQSKTLKLLLLK